MGPRRCAGLARRKIAAELAALTPGRQGLQLMREAEVAESAYESAARRCRRRAESRRRKCRSDRRTRATKLEGAHFTTEFASRKADGYDQVEFWVQTNPGSKPAP
jgi:DNA repair protein RecN (Recombination protein N)